MRALFAVCGILLPIFSFAQGKHVHANAHAHNDYEHARPLLDALKSGFASVEADVHLHDGQLLVGHNRVSDDSPSLEALYLRPLDSILGVNHGRIFDDATSYLMIDIKTDAEQTYQALSGAINRHNLRRSGPVCIFLSGNRPSHILESPNSDLAVDGRPSDLGKGYGTNLMPVISDRYSNWSTWNGRGASTGKLDRVRQLAQRVHAEGKLLRLWAIPDNEYAWSALLDAGVDLINTDLLEELDRFLLKRGR